MVKYQRKSALSASSVFKKLLRQRTRITQITLMNADKEKDIWLIISEKKSAKIRVIRVIRVQKLLRQRTRITQMTLMNADKEKNKWLNISEKNISENLCYPRHPCSKKTIATKNADNADDTDERR